MIDLSRYRPASYDGIGFHVSSSSRRLSKRVDEKRYPFASRSLISDMGADAPRFDLEIFVLGADAHLRRSDLEEAFARPGPGLLVHPTRGELRVQVITLSERERSTELGVADFRVSFVLVAEGSGAQAASPQAIVDTQAGVIRAADRAQDLVLLRFEEEATALSPDEQELLPGELERLAALLDAQSGRLEGLTLEALARDLPGAGSAVPATAGLVGSAVPATAGLVGSAVPATAGLVGSAVPATAVARLGRAALAFVGRMAAIRNSPLEAITGLASLIAPGSGALLSLLPDPAAQGTAEQKKAGSQNHNRERKTDFAALLARPVRSPEGLFFTQSKAEDNQASRRLATGLFLQATILQAARLATTARFDTLDQALSLRDLLGTAIRTASLVEPQGTGSPAFYENRAALRSLGVALSRDITERSLALPELQAFTPQAPITARVLAWRLNQSLPEQYALARRNAVTHRSFVPAGGTLLVKKNPRSSIRGIGGLAS